MKTEKKKRLQQLRRWRIRKRIHGTCERPRMSVRFSNKNIYVQFVDDDTGVTLAAASTVQKGRSEGIRLAANVSSAQKIGELAAAAARKVGIQRIVFDRSGARYHGKVGALADAARAGGLTF